MPEISTGHHKRCEFAVGASEILDKRHGVSPWINTEAAAWIDMQLMWSGTINPLIVINVSGRDYASAEVSDDWQYAKVPDSRIIPGPLLCWWAGVERPVIINRD